jgi:hypothetical protein
VVTVPKPSPTAALRPPLTDATSYAVLVELIPIEVVSNGKTVELGHPFRYP